MVTVEQLIRIMPFAKSRAAKFIDGINAAMLEFHINTKARQAAFLAQIGHESGQLLYTREIASGDAYEGRKDLGNTWPGDGRKYRGRGLLQITGRSNMAACGEALGLDLLDHPQLLELPEHACRSAAWWWEKHGCNELADAGDQIKLTKKINGGTNGLDDRLALLEVAEKVLA